MSKKELKISKPSTPLKPKDLIGRAPKQVDNAPEGSWMTRGVHTVSQNLKPANQESIDGHQVRGCIKPIPDGVVHSNEHMDFHKRDHRRSIL